MEWVDNFQGLGYIKILLFIEQVNTEVLLFKKGWEGVAS